MEEILQSSSIGKLYLLLKDMQSLSPQRTISSIIEDLLCKVDGVESKLAFYQGLHSLMNLLDRVYLDLKENEKIPKELYDGHINKITSAFNNGLVNTSNNINEILKYIPKESVEALQHLAFSYNNTVDVPNPINQNDIEELKELIKLLRDEVQQLDLDYDFKGLILRHIKELEKMIIEYELYGKAFVEESLKEFMGTATIAKENLVENMKLGQKFFDIANKLIVIAQVTEYGQKFLPQVTTFIKALPLN